MKTSIYHKPNDIAGVWGDFGFIENNV